MKVIFHRCFHLIVNLIICFLKVFSLCTCPEIHWNLIWVFFLVLWKIKNSYLPFIGEFGYESPSLASEYEKFFRDSSRLSSLASLRFTSVRTQSSGSNRLSGEHCWNGTIGENMSNKLHKLHEQYMFNKAQLKQWPSSTKRFLYTIN